MTFIIFLVFTKVHSVDRSFVRSFVSESVLAFRLVRLFFFQHSFLSLHFCSIISSFPITPLYLKTLNILQGFRGAPGPMGEQGHDGEKVTDVLSKFTLRTVDYFF